MGDVKLYSMDDVGTRAEHLLELHDIWGSCYAILTAQGWHSAQEKEKARKIQVAMDMLTNYLEIGYSYTLYARETNKLENPDIT